MNAWEKEGLEEVSCVYLKWVMYTIIVYIHGGNVYTRVVCIYMDDVYTLKKIHIHNKYIYT